MMLNKFHKQQNQKGFTLIELLIVVAIIGILAAIAIPQFAAYRERAYNSAATSDLRTIKVGLEAFMADYQEYPEGLTDSAKGEEVFVVGADATGEDTVVGRLSNNVNLLYSVAADESSFAIITYHDNGSFAYGTASDATQLFRSDDEVDADGDWDVSLAATDVDAEAFDGWDDM